MASLNAVIVPTKALKDGRHKIRISVAHNGATRYIVTNIIVDSEKEFKRGAIVKRPDAAMLNTKLRGLLQKYQDLIDELDYIDGLTCPELVFLIKNGGNFKHPTLASIYNEYMDKACIKPSTAKLYKMLWNNIKNHLGEQTLIEHINHATILGLDQNLRKRGIAQPTIRNYMVFLRSLLNYARHCGYVQYRIDPYFGYQIPEMGVRQSWLSVEEIKKIRDLKIQKRNVRRCRDLFMLSYYLGGINIVDLLKINFNEQDKVICYIRTKTELRQKMNKFVEFEIPEEAQKIINKYKGADGYIEATERQRSCRFQDFFRHNFPIISKAAGIKHLIYYSARKSFSQHAFDLGISTSVIDFILGHRVDKGVTSLYSYIHVTPAMATNAVRKVLDNLK